MVLIANKTAASAGPYHWEVGGDEGAIEVEPEWADELLSIASADFYQVVPAPKTETPKKAPAKKAAEPVPPEELVPPAADISDALAVASPTRSRRSTTKA